MPLVRSLSVNFGQPVTKDTAGNATKENNFKTTMEDVTDLIKTQLIRPYEKEIDDLKEENRSLSNRVAVLERLCSARAPEVQEIRLAHEEMEKLKDRCTALNNSNIDLAEQINALKKENASLKGDSVIGTSAWFKGKLEAVEGVMHEMKREFALHVSGREGKIKILENELKEEKQRNERRAEGLRKVKEILTDMASLGNCVEGIFTPEQLPAICSEK
ncbi:uncharacterized protein EI97DRAFT_441709 [Westerdykella ornata]|uniref:Uncharacterized protein n=1 Tax=Westerdykella ornata TaxID=318751 RepID=A0A6A6JNJ1_WESOR|nr:uncharacterized protein EI97DRAFT_441709 [Westerdykella ornata]KAF2277693.1 hypothetical protein EI97DRAFT_441709 [Westerdykella ornata]